VDEVVDEASVMEVADSSAYNSFARQPDGLPRERARSGRFRMAKLKYYAMMPLLPLGRSLCVQEAPGVSV
jgi:hypothetical protein